MRRRIVDAARRNQPVGEIVVSQQVLCVIAGQRAGTTALRSALGATGRFENFGEIFHTEDLNKPGSYFGFCRDRSALVSDLCTGPQIKAHCDAYMAHLTQIAGEKHVLIDVKFNSWNVANPAWRYFDEEPQFLTYLKNMKSAFVFIRRLDLAAQIISESIARAADKWHNLSDEELSDAPINLNINKVRRQARLICDSEVRFRNFLKGYPKTAFLDYEALFDEDGISGRTKSELSNLIGEELAFGRSVAIRKNTVDKNSRVTNYDEIVGGVAEVAARYNRHLAAG